MFVISTALLPSPLFERVRVRAEASMMLGIAAVVASLALAPWEMTEQPVKFELAAAQEPAELLKPLTIEIASRSEAPFAVTRRVHHPSPNRRHAHLGRTMERARVF